jgi:predicted membrane protein (TIGR00267 family)
VSRSANPLAAFGRALERVREYERISGFSQIARRALANNGFDGVLTTIGLLIGSYAAGVRSATIVVRTGLATAVAMGVSGLWGAYLAENAERGRDLADLEHLSLTDLRHTKIGRASRVAVVAVAVVDGLAPLGAALIVLIPMFVLPHKSDIRLAYGASLLIALAGLFGLGMFLGHISGRNILLYGLRTLVAGVISIAFGFLLGGVEP